MANLLKIKVEGTVDNYSVLKQELSTPFASEKEAIDALTEEVAAHRRAGGEVVMSGSDRAFFINSSNRCYEMWDVQV